MGVVILENLSVSRVFTCLEYLFASTSARSEVGVVGRNNRWHFISVLIRVYNSTDLRSNIHMPCSERLCLSIR